MEILHKILEVLFIFIIVFIINKYAVKWMIDSLVNFHKRNNQENLNKHPIKFLIQNQKQIYIIFCSFYWFSALMISYRILFK